MAKLTLNLACRWYDRVAGLIDGSVRPEGIDLNFIDVPNYEIFWRVLRHAEFDVAELSASAYLHLLEREAPPYIAIPVFPSRLFRHGCIYINTAAGIRDPRDLRGKRVGNPEYAQTASLWVRGILKDQYGLAASDMQWFRGGLEAPDSVQRDRLDLPPDIHLATIPDGSTLSGLLEAGELDAVLTPQTPAPFVRGSPRVARLFPDYRAAEMAYYQQTGLFPIMHLVAIKRDLYEANPWIAASLMKAFEASKTQCYERIVYTGVLSASLPWLHADLEAEFAFFGRDPFVYGLEPNRPELEAMIRYSREQGLTRTPRAVEELFAPESIDLFATTARQGQAAPIGPLRYIQTNTAPPA